MFIATRVFRHLAWRSSASKLVKPSQFSSEPAPKDLKDKQNLSFSKNESGNEKSKSEGSVVKLSKPDESCKDKSKSEGCVVKLSKPDESGKDKPKSEGSVIKLSKPLDTSFNNVEEAYRSKTTWEVLRAYIVYKLCSSTFIVDNNPAIMKIAKGILGERLFSWTMKHSFYGHFVAGEDRHKIVPTLTRMQAFGVRSILDYSVEEDLTQDEAEKREMTSSTSEQKQDAKDKNLVGGEMPQYTPSKQFADRRYKVKSARTYFYVDEESCEKNLQIFLDCLETSAKYANGTAFTAVKLTALGRPQLLLQISEVIMRARKFVSEVIGGKGNVLGQHLTADDLAKRLEQAGIKDTKKFLSKVVTDREGVIHLFPWSGLIDTNLELNETFRVPSLKEGRMVRIITELSKKEENMFRNMINRLNELSKAAQDLNVRIMIDAEQIYFQPAISRLTMELMNKYNKDRAYIFNTYQCYLKDAHNEILMDIAQANRQKFNFACKLVRGAYLEQERARAAAMNYPDPTNASFEDTSTMYRKCIDECLKYHKGIGDGDKASFMVASHNEDSTRYAIEKMKELGIRPESEIVRFGQLYGMCDYITFPLGQAGYAAYKYVPYGPVAEVLPYLSRRAQENRGVLEKAKKEKQLIRQELGRRIKKGQIVHKVNVPPS